LNYSAQNNSLSSRPGQVILGQDWQMFEVVSPDILLKFWSFDMYKGPGKFHVDWSFFKVACPDVSLEFITRFKL
jgi:hypothetical protein